MSRTRTFELELERAADYRTELRRFLRRTDDVTRNAGLTPQRYDLLLMIRTGRRGDRRATVSELAERLHLEQTAVSELVRRAIDGGLITREQSADDGRVWLLRLTRAGERRLLNAFRELRADRAALIHAVRRVAAAAGRVPRSSDRR